VFCLHSDRIDNDSCNALKIHDELISTTYHIQPECHSTLITYDVVICVVAWRGGLDERPDLTWSI